MQDATMRFIARVHTAFSEKFGIPRQSGLAPSLRARIVFEPAFRRPEALRGLEGFSHIWLIWQFSEAVRDTWQPTVRPPRLGGNARMGVFATRSPFRPNAIGLSAVKLEGIEWDAPDGPVLIVSGADLLDGTPLFDIKPYIPFADCLPEAVGGFAAERPEGLLQVSLPEQIAASLPAGVADMLREVLACDPRPSYQHDPERIYGMAFGGYNVTFTVDGDTLTVINVLKKGE